MLEASFLHWIYISYIKGLYGFKGPFSYIVELFWGLFCSSQASFYTLETSFIFLFMSNTTFFHWRRVLILKPIFFCIVGFLHWWTLLFIWDLFLTIKNLFLTLDTSFSDYASISVSYIKTKDLVLSLEASCFTGFLFI